jgi:hypothetical protein
MNRILVLLAALAAVASAAEAQQQWVPDELVISLTEASLDQRDWEVPLRGEVGTGLASLDSLIQRTGVVAVTPLAGVTYQRERYLLRFAAATDPQITAVLYMQNEHVALAEPSWDQILSYSLRSALWVPHEVTIRIEETSQDQINWDGLMRGELETGLASLDALNQRTGVSAVRPLAPHSGGRSFYWLRYGLDVDAPTIAALYMENGHVKYAEPNWNGQTAALTDVPWFLVKRSAARTRAQRPREPGP